MTEYRLHKIDKDNRHYYLRENDDCHYIIEFKPPLHFSNGEDEQLLYNLKKLMHKRHNNDEWRHKEKAIKRCGYLLKDLFSRANTNYLVIPVPPSNIKTHPDYDDRLHQILTIATQQNQTVTYDENILWQTENYAASHKQNSNDSQDTDKKPRIKPDELQSIYHIDESKLVGHDNIIIFDDIITTGAHYSAIRDVLYEKSPNAKLTGLFIGRAVHSPIEGL